MPKYPSDKRRFYDDRERMSGEQGGRAMGRARSVARGGDHRDGDREGYRRPGPSDRPSQPGSSSAPYPTRPSSSAERSSSLGRQQKSLMRSETGSDASGPTSDAPSLGRGALRGRRVLPADIITRPRELVTKKGGSGAQINMQANYFRLISIPDWKLYQYRVDFEPEQDRTVARKYLLKQHRELLGAYVFDGTLLYTSNQLTQPLQLQTPNAETNQDVQITVQHVGDMAKGDHHYIQFFNIIMRKCLEHLKLQLVGRNYFDAKNKVAIQEHKLELWPGYITSIRQHEQDILLCSEVTHKVMRNETLLTILNDCYHYYKGEYQKHFCNQVIGIVVLTDYNNNTYRVDDVNWTIQPTSTFTMKNGEEISYLDYYRKRYNIQITTTDQPLLVSRSKARDRRAGKEELVYLIPELCRSTGLTDAMRNNFRLMQALAKYTRVSPAERIKKLNVFNRRLQQEAQIRAELKDWNLELDTELVSFTGRVLPADAIKFKHNTVSVNNFANWTNEFRNQHLVKVGELDQWYIVANPRLRRDVDNFVNCLRRASQGMGFEMSNPKFCDIHNDHVNAYAEALESIRSRFSPKLILCIASNNRADRYSAIKKKCCVDRPVPTQVVLQKNLTNKNLMSIATKIAIQINCKIGGMPWSVSIPLTGSMVVGFDVCHDTQMKGRDFGAMVASLDAHFARYFSAVSCHTNGEELSSNFSVNLCKAIDVFKTYNAALPRKIFIYRDGVGDGQIPFVVNHEIKQIKEKLSEVYPSPDDIKLAFIIVTKKVNSRFFYKAGNPPPGTVIDDVVTDPSKYDFFIVSQHVKEGTVTPTSYNVVEDTAGLDADKIHRLTYKLCHMYFNWSGTVRVPAPCQYAHKLAFLVAQAIHQSPDNFLETLLYFL